MRIGNVQLNSNILFAPIAGFSDVGLRHLCARYGAGLTYTELVSAKGIVYNNKGTAELLATLDSPCAVQLFGHEPEFMYKAVKDERLSGFDVFDINAGCPVKKVFGNGDGSALMLNPTLLGEVVQAVKEGSKKPVTVKIRAGVEEGKPLAIECAAAAEKYGASAVTVHPRYRAQFYSGYADHSITKEVKNSVKIPVIANGDIVDKASLERVKNLTGADGFMIARGALGRPYIFAELLGKEYKYDRYQAVMEHIEILRKYMPDRVVGNVMKLQLCHYAKGEDFAKAVRIAVGEAKSLDDIFRISSTFFKH
ncbi:MAG: tRNA-dihydrouridine synthase [Clostridia bacterium]|nr:tRNA-dihydrouridine synthase [Clostridia bacterium]